MSIIARFCDRRSGRRLAAFLAVVIVCGEWSANAGPPKFAPGRTCIPTDQLPPLPTIRAHNTPEKLLAHLSRIDRVEIFDPIERRVISTLTGRRVGWFTLPFLAATPAWVSKSNTHGIQGPQRWRTVFLMHPKDGSLPFLAHPISASVLRLHADHPYERGFVEEKFADLQTDILADQQQILTLADALGAVRPLADFCPATIRMPACAIEQARWANEPVHPPRIRPNNTAKQLLASKNRITRIKIWSASHRGVIGELDETEVADLIKQLGQATSPRNEWSGGPRMWDAVLLVYTRGSELPFAVHVMDEFSLRVSHSDPMSTAIWADEDRPEPRTLAHDVVVEHGLLDILPRYLGPEDPFWKLEHQRQREVQRRCHPHSDIGEDPFPHLPMARIEPVDP